MRELTASAGAVLEHQSTRWDRVGCPIFRRDRCDRKRRLKLAPPELKPVWFYVDQDVFYPIDIFAQGGADCGGDFVTGADG